METKDINQTQIQRFLSKDKEEIENRTFNEYNIRHFLHLFSRSKKYYILSSYEEIVKRRLKDNLLKSWTIEEKLQKNPIVYKEHPYKGSEDKFYYNFQIELSNFAKEYGIKMDSQTIKEIVLCIYSLLQFTSVQGYRFCFLLKQNAIVFGYFHHDEIYDLSTIPVVQTYTHYPYDFINELVRCKRIDGKLKLVTYKGEVIAEI